MVPAFDIFRIFSDGETLWIEAAATLHDAITQIQQLGAIQPGEYFIHSRKTGVEVSITVERSVTVEPQIVTRLQPPAIRYEPRMKAEN